MNHARFDSLTPSRPQEARVRFPNSITVPKRCVFASLTPSTSLQVGVEARMHRKALLKHVETFQAWGVSLELLVVRS